MPCSMQKDYPEEYITGKVQFFGRDFVVTPDVLIPRLETEGLVRRARKIIEQEHIQTVVDIGTGSGIIATSCADLVDSVVLLDISEKALEVAKKNFRTHFPSKKIDFTVSDLLSNLPIFQPSSTLFVANLPYIKQDDWENMSPDTRHEPRLALFGWERTGFELYEKLFEQFQRKDIHGILLIEFGFDQRQVAEEVLRPYPWKYEFFADYAGIERFAEIRL